MKKTIKFVAMLLVGVLMFASCQKEGQYLPKKKITRIDHVATMDISGTPTTIVNEYETWEWSGKLLTKITYYRSNDEVVGFITPQYDSKKRIESFHSEMESTIFDYVVTYDGKNLMKITCYDSNNELVSEYQFTKEDGQVMTITYETFNEEVAKCDKVNPVNLILPSEVVENLQPSKGKRVNVNTLTWDGKNLASMKTVVDGDETSYIEYTWTYDNCINPKQGLFSQPGFAEFFKLYSANNALTNKVVTHSNNLNLTIDSEYAYEYEDEYPVKQTWTATSMGLEINHTTTYTYQE